MLLYVLQSTYAMARPSVVHTALPCAVDFSPSKCQCGGAPAFAAAHLSAAKEQPCWKPQSPARGASAAPQLTPYQPESAKKASVAGPKMGWCDT